MVSCFSPLLVRLLCSVALATAISGCAAGWRSPEALGRCYQLYGLWLRYETEHSPNQTGQRAQAEWALYRCQIGDFDSGFRELERLLRRNLIGIPGEPRQADSRYSEGLPPRVLPRA